MAIIESIRIYEERLLQSLNIEYNGLRLVELGNQTYNGKPAKKLYEAKGVIHTSIDINGKDGALPLDLSHLITEPIRCDLLTNYGTTEHVANQYECFNNIHNMVAVNGIMIHGVPFVNNWAKHGRYYFTPNFFTSLSVLCGYKIIDIQILNEGFYKFPKNLVLAVLQKNKDNEFIGEHEFGQIVGIIDSGDTSRTQNYTR
jgi:hypothetical protein